MLQYLSPGDLKPSMCIKSVSCPDIDPLNYLKPAAFILLCRMTSYSHKVPLTYLFTPTCCDLSPHFLLSSLYNYYTNVAHHNLSFLALNILVYL